MLSKQKTRTNIFRKTYFNPIKELNYLLFPELFYRLHIFYAAPSTYSASKHLHLEKDINLVFALF